MILSEVQRGGNMQTHLIQNLSFLPSFPPFLPPFLLPVPSLLPSLRPLVPFFFNSINIYFTLSTWPVIILSIGNLEFTSGWREAKNKQTDRDIIDLASNSMPESFNLCVTSENESFGVKWFLQPFSTTCKLFNVTTCKLFNLSGIQHPNT